jgi:hypothetical protein
LNLIEAVLKVEARGVQEVDCQVFVEKGNEMILFRLTVFLALFVLTGCLGTAPIITNVQRASQPLKLSQTRVAVLSFAGAPTYPETGRFAQELATSLLVQGYDISLVSPSKVEAYLREKNIVPNEYDQDELRKISQDLNVDVVLWGTVNQFTPYKFDRLTPATPPYVEITLYGFRQGYTSISKVNGRNQGEIPATIYSRQPTFEDVAQPLILQLLRLMN